MPRSACKNRVFPVSVSHGAYRRETGNAVGSTALPDLPPAFGCRLGDAVPQTPWDLSLYACSSKGDKTGGSLPARLIRTLLFASLQIGAQVASLRCPILRWSSGETIKSKAPGKGPNAEVRFCSHVRFC